MTTLTIEIECKPTGDIPIYDLKSDNYFEQLPLHIEESTDSDSAYGDLRIYMYADPKFINKIIDVSYESGNTFEYFNGCGYYSVTPKPEACTTLFTNYNIQTSGVVIGENIESHVFVLNSLGNTVDINANQISQLQNICAKLQQEIEELRPKTTWFDIVMDIVQISNFAFAFGGAAMKIGSQGIKWLNKLSLQKPAQAGVELEFDDVAYSKGAYEIRSVRNSFTEELVFIKSGRYSDTKYVHVYMCNFIENGDIIEIVTIGCPNQGLASQKQNKKKRY